MSIVSNKGDNETMKPKASETIYLDVEQKNVMQIEYSEISDSDLSDKLFRAVIKINNEKPFKFDFDHNETIEAAKAFGLLFFQLFGVAKFPKILDQIANDVRSLQIDLQAHQKKYTPVIPMTKQEEVDECMKRG